MLALENCIQGFAELVPKMFMVAWKKNRLGGFNNEPAQLIILMHTVTVVLHRSMECHKETNAAECVANFTLYFQQATWGGGVPSSYTLHICSATVSR